MQRAARVAARLLAAPLRAWERLWLVDAAALRALPTIEEHQRTLEAALESNRLLRRAAMSRYAKDHLLPRMHLGQGLIPGFLPRTGGGGLCVTERGGGGAERQRLAAGAPQRTTREARGIKATH